MWIARDKNGVLYLHKNKPQKFEKEGVWRTDASLNTSCDGFYIPKVRWEDDEPVEIIFKKG